LLAEFDLRAAAIIDQLDLQRPIYEPTAAYGHFGRTDVALPWEADTLHADASRGQGAATATQPASDARRPG
jgi:S-adenosylmethionine synthetase